MNYVKCNFKVGDRVAPIPEEFHNIFKFGDTADKILSGLESSERVVQEIVQYSCGCTEKNGGEHTCVLKAAGCDQAIVLHINGKKKRFAGKLFCRESV